MAGEDVKRLILQVDASVELARRNLTELSKTVDTESKRMEGALGRVDTAHRRLAVSSGSARASQMEMMHVVRASSDAFAAGIPVQQIFFSELGRVAEAASMAGGALGKVGAFLASPYGLAVMAGVAVLGHLIMAHKGAGAAADGHAKAEKSLTDTIREQLEAARSANANELETLQHHIDGARAAMTRANAERQLTKALLEQAVVQQARARGGIPSAGNDQGSAFAGVGAALAGQMAARPQLDAAVKAGKLTRTEANALLANAGDVTALQARLKALDVDIAATNKLLGETDIEFASAFAPARVDAGAAATVRHNQALVRLHAEYRALSVTQRQAQGKDRAWLTEQEARLDRIYEKEKKAAQDRSSDSPAAGNQATDLAYMESFLRRELPGVRITSTTGGKHVAGSDHYAGRAIDFVPAGGVGSITKDDVRQLFEDNGMRIRRNKAGVEQLFGPGDKGHSDHFHVAWDGRPPSDKSITRTEESAAEKKRREDADWANMVAGANEDLLKAKKALAGAAEDQEALAIAEVRQEQDIKTSQMREKARIDGRSKAEADAMVAKIALTAEDKIALIKQKSAAKTAQERMRAELDGLRTDEEMAQLDGQLAETTKDRRDAAKRLLALAEQSERIQLQAIVADKELAKSDPSKVQAAQDRLDALHGIYEKKGEIVDRENESPGQRYVRDLGTGLKDVGDRIQAIEVEGLQRFEDSLARSIAKTLGLKGALGQVLEEIIKIGLERELILPIANALFGGGSGGDGGEGLLGSLLGMFASGGGGAGGLGTFTFAGGGDPPVGRVSLVGEQGPELFVPKVPGTIIPNGALRGMGAPQQVHVTVEASEDFEVKVVTLAGAMVKAHAPAIEANAAGKVMKALTQRPLP